MTTMTLSSLELAITYKKAGYSVIPIGAKKLPAFEILPKRFNETSKKDEATWIEFNTRQPSINELMKFFGDDGRFGFGLVQGAISGNSEVLDFETVEAYEQWYEQVQEQGLHSYVDQLPMVRSPNGIHLYYRLDECLGGGTALARQANKELLIEFRADKQYVVAPGSPAHCHPNNESYKLLRGSISEVPVLLKEVRDQLHDLARSFDELPATPMYTFRGSVKTGSRPGEDFDQKADWHKLLEEYGWELKKQNGDRSTWIKPNSQSKMHHATLGHCKRAEDGLPLFYVFSSEAHPFDVRAYSPWQFYAVVKHNGDYQAAAKALAKEGYGEQQPKRDKITATRKNAAVQETDDFGNPTNWSELLPFENPQVDEIDPDLLPTWVGQYAAAVADYTQTPKGLAVLMALSVLGTCLQKKFVVSPTGGSYREPLSIWTMTVLPPGNRKTAVVDLISKPIELWEQKEYLRLKDFIAETDTAIDISQRRIEELKRKAAKEEDATLRTGYKNDIKREMESIPRRVKVPDLFATDITPEALQTAYADNQGKYAIITDEGAILDILGGLYSNGKANIDPFLKGHAGGALKVKRQSRQVNLPNIALSVGIAIQPEAANDASGGKKIFRGKGLLPRFLFCVPESLVGRRDEVTDRAIDDSLATQYKSRLLNLLDIRSEVDENDEIKPAVLTLTPRAKERWIAFKQAVEYRIGPNNELEAITDWGGKLAGAMLRIAGVSHIAEFGPGNKEINDDTVAKSIKLCESLISHAQKALGALSVDPVLEDAEFIVNILKAKTEQHPDSGAFFIRRRILQKTGRFNHSKPDRLNKALEILKDRNAISDEFSRRVNEQLVKIHFVNPEVLSQ